jgi:RNA polymerase sigma-70 factor (ECF subfamily)
LADALDAEEAAQDAMLHLCDRLGNWDQARAYRSWRTTVVANLCRDRLRRRDTRARLEGSAACERPLHTDPNPSAALEARELQALLQRALALLSPREREAFVLRDLEGQSTEAVAGALGIEAASVRSLVTLARRRLRLHMGAQLFDGAELDDGR